MRINQIHGKISKDTSMSPFIRIPIVMSSSWFFQCLLYMDKTEKFFKILIDLILFILIFTIINGFFSFILAIVLGFLFAHTINWIINGQIPVALKNSGILKKRISQINDYSISIQNQIKNNPSIIYGAIIGSSSRNKLKVGSDLDVRIVRKRGLLNSICSYLFVMKLRFKALLYFFPLDIYLLDNFRKIRSLGEPPMIFHNIQENSECRYDE